MIAFLSSYNQARLQSKLYATQAAAYRKNAKAARNRSSSQAHAIEQAAKDNQLIEAQNLMKAQASKHAQEGKAINAMATSGFDTTKGTGGKTLADVQSALDAEIDNMVLASSIAMNNAWQSALDTRRQGEIEAAAYEAQAQQAQTAANQSNKAARVGLFAGLINGAYSAYQGYQSASLHNQSMQDILNRRNSEAESAFKNGSISQEQYNQRLADNQKAFEQNSQSTSLSAYNAFSAGSYGGFHFINSFNPYTAALSADANNRKNNWGGFLSVLSGNVPYKVPAAGAIFSSY